MESSVFERMVSGWLLVGNEIPEMLDLSDFEAWLTEEGCVDARGCDLFLVVATFK